MAVNSDKPQNWKVDIARSVDFYNSWFMRFVPKAYRKTRIETTKQVELALKLTANLTNLSPELLQHHPSILAMLRMATAPPLARDRLIGLAGVSSSLIKTMELENRIPPRMKSVTLLTELQQISQIILRLTKDPADEYQPDFSPDGTKIAFSLRTSSQSF